MNRGAYISPPRAKSKLRKRRRQRESAVSTGSLKSVPPAAAASSLNDKTTHEYTVGTLGARGGMQHRSLLQKENNTAGIVKPTPRSDGSSGLTDSQSNLTSEKAPTRDITAASKLSCIDEMDLTELSAIGKDIMSSFTNMDVTIELERAFASSNDFIESTDRSNVFSHDVIGRLGPPDAGGDNGAFSIAFPQCNTAVTRNGLVNARNSSMSFQDMNLKRLTCYGMSIPLSWCQFPGSQTGQNNTNTNSTTVTDNTNSVRNDLVSEKEQVVISTPPQYQGKIRITSVKGATIREVFDIDESDHVIGKLNQGDERYFIEKRFLPAPPPDSNDDTDDDESDDEECIAVFRYKIVLNEQDCIGCNPELVGIDATSGKMVGWISDRGRLANDPYFILKEFDNSNTT